MSIPIKLWFCFEQFFVLVSSKHCITTGLCRCPVDASQPLHSSTDPSPAPLLHLWPPSTHHHRSLPLPRRRLATASQLRRPTSSAAASPLASSRSSVWRALLLREHPASRQPRSASTRASTQHRAQSVRRLAQLELQRRRPASPHRLPDLQTDNLLLPLPDLGF